MGTHGSALSAWQIKEQQLNRDYAWAHYRLATSAAALASIPLLPDGDGRAPSWTQEQYYAVGKVVTALREMMQAQERIRENKPRSTFNAPVPGSGWQVDDRAGR